MRVIVWGINYAPEQTGIGPYNAALCNFLLKKGHQVEMIAAFEYYPHWEKKRADCGRLYRDEDQSGVSVHRCWLYVPKHVRSWKRIAHELTFVLTSMIRALWLRRPDVYVVVSPPLLLGMAAAVVGFCKRAPFVLHVQDLQPDAAIRLGMLQAGGVMSRVLFALESLSYRCAARVSTISAGILRMMKNKQVPASKLVFFPNGVRLPEGLPAMGLFRERHGIPKDSFVVLYSGNLGVKQGLAVLISAACLLQRRTAEPARIQFVIAGAGAARQELAAQIKEAGLRNVLLLPLQPEPAYREMLVDADCCAITQQPGTGELFFPSKLLTTLAYAKPVLCIADPESDLAVAVAEGGFGINVPTGSAAAVVEALDQWSHSKAELIAQGARGREYVARYELDQVSSRFENELLRVLRPPPSITAIPVAGPTSPAPSKDGVGT